jgi:hypothetical protein
MRDRKERLEIVERNKETLLASYAEAVPEAIDRSGYGRRRAATAPPR